MHWDRSRARRLHCVASAAHTLTFCYRCLSPHTRSCTLIAPPSNSAGNDADGVKWGRRRPLAPTPSCTHPIGPTRGQTRKLPPKTKECRALAPKDPKRPKNDLCVYLRFSCLQERIAFDDCYAKALRAVRAPFNGDSTPNDSFFDSSERYRAQIEQCLGGPEEPPFDFNGNEFTEQNHYFEQIIFGTDLADRMWELPEASSVGTHRCVHKDFGRLFGAGISRILDTAKTSINNLNTSCILKEEEVTCYKRELASDDRFQQALKNREQTLRGCIQSIRLQTQCRGGTTEKLRTCICDAREEFDNRLQASLLECTRKSDIGKLYAELLERGIDQGKLKVNDDADVVGMSHEGQTEDVFSLAPMSSASFPLPPSLLSQEEEEEEKAILSEPIRFVDKGGATARTSPLNKHRYHPSTTPYVASNALMNMITPGVVLGGQCLCACPSVTQLQSQQQQLQRQQQRDGAPSSSGSNTQFASYPSPSVTGAASTVAQVPPQPQTYPTSTYTGYRGGYYSPAQATARYLDPLTAVEWGVSNGFQRFFNGLPPTR